MEAEEAQDTQVVLGDALGRIADEADPARVDIGEPAHIVEDRTGSIDRERIHGEVAPLRVDLPVAAERDLGLAAEGLDVGAQRGDLEGHAVDDHRDGAVVDPGRHRLEARRAHALDHRTRQRGGGDIDLVRPLPEHGVAHGAADHAGLLARMVEHRQQVGERAGLEPSHVWQGALHFIFPGTSCPFSICAGS